MTTQIITVLACGGIGESGTTDTRTEVSGMLSYVTAKLDPMKFTSQWVPWAASYGPVPRPDGMSYADSIRSSLDMLAATIRNSRNDVIGLGYSAGATLWSSLLEEIAYEGKHQDIRGKIKGVAFIAHPERRRNDSFGGLGKGFGVGGEWLGGPDEIPTIEIAAPEDMICCCPEDSPIRTLADQTSAMSFVNVHTWAADLADRIRKNRWQAVRINWWNPIGVWNQYTRAADDIAGYLFRKDHVSYHVRNMPGETVSYTTKLAQILNASVFH